MFDISIIIDVVILGQKVFGPYDTRIASHFMLSQS